MRRTFLLAVMRRLTIIVVVVLSACATPLVSRGALAASTVALAADWQTTRCFARRGWMVDGYTFAEGNPIMGPEPTARGVDGYFLAAAVVNVLAYTITPRRWRAMLPLAVTVVSLDRAAHNAALAHGRGICGL